MSISSNSSSSSSVVKLRRASSQQNEQIPRKETIDLRQKHVAGACTLFYKEDPLKIVRAKGQYMYNESGDEFLDCINNVGHVGHCHPHVVKAGQEQMAILNTNSRFLHDNMVLYAERLTKTFPEELSVVFFVNSGSEANDLALRIARAHTGSREVITLDHAYHGHVISLIDISPYKFATQGGEGCPPETHVVPVADIYRGKYRDIDHPNEDLGTLYANEVKKVCDDLKSRGKKPSCYIAESLQCCGGQIVYPPGYLQSVYAHVRAAGGVCIADEVQVGFGRVGAPHYWAFQPQGVVPDIVTIGKPMGNGHPVAAVITTKALAQSFGATGMSYFNTFAGNPVSCAIASAVLDVIEDENLLEHGRKVGSYLIAGFLKLQDKYEMIGDVRGLGMIFGVDIVSNRATRQAHPAAAKHVVERLRAERILLQTDGPYENVLKFKAPMCFQMEDADRLLSTVDKILGEMKNCPDFANGRTTNGVNGAH